MFESFFDKLSVWAEAFINLIVDIFNRMISFSNYSAPIEVSPIGMSDHLTVLQQQELHCISNFRSS